jgi:hypothetical protein
MRAFRDRKIKTDFTFDKVSKGWPHLTKGSRRKNKCFFTNGRIFFPAAGKPRQKLATLVCKPSNVLLKMRKPPCSLLSVLSIKFAFKKDRLVEPDQGSFVPQEFVSLNMGCQKPIRIMCHRSGNS